MTDTINLVLADLHRAGDVRAQTLREEIAGVQAVEFVVEPESEAAAYAHYRAASGGLISARVKLEGSVLEACRKTFGGES